MGGLAGLVAPYRPETLVRRAVHEYVVRANWKVITENYHECYHCPLIHPELCAVSPPASGDNFDLPGAWVGGSMDLRDDAVTMSLDGRSDGRPIEGVDPRTVLYLGLLPNLLLSLHPDYVMTHRMVPLSPGRDLGGVRVVLPGRRRRPGVRRGVLGHAPTGRTGRPASRCSAGWPRRTSAPARSRPTRTRFTSSSRPSRAPTGTAGSPSERERCRAGR